MEPLDEAQVISLVSALLSIRRPASVLELSQRCLASGSPVEEIGTVCTSPASPLCFTSDGMVTFSPRADAFFMEVVLSYQQQAMRPSGISSSFPRLSYFNTSCPLGSSFNAHPESLLQPSAPKGMSLTSISQNSGNASQEQELLSRKRSHAEDFSNLLESQHMEGKARRVSVTCSPAHCHKKPTADDTNDLVPYIATSDDAGTTSPECIAAAPMQDMLEPEQLKNTDSILHCHLEMELQQPESHIAGMKLTRISQSFGNASHAEDYANLLESQHTEGKAGRVPVAASCNYKRPSAYSVPYIATSGDASATSQKCIAAAPEQLQHVSVNKGTDSILQCHVGFQQPESQIAGDVNTFQGGEASVLALEGERRTTVPGSPSSRLLLATEAAVSQLKAACESPSKTEQEAQQIPLFQDYRVEAEEGSGGYSTVYKARRIRDDKVFAIKCPSQGVSKDQVDKEIRMLIMLGGKHCIIKMEEVIRDHDNACIVLDYVEHDKIETLKKEITISELRWYGFYLFKALNYLHQKRIMHRDVKPGNFLFSRKSNLGYLVDFNLASEVPILPKRAGMKNNRVLEGLTFMEERKALVKRQTNSESLAPNLQDSGRTGALLSFSTARAQQRAAVAPIEPLPTTGRRQLIDYVAKTVTNPQACITGVKRKRVAAPKNLKVNEDFQISRKTPLPNASTRRSPGLKRRGVCVGTKGYSAPEVLLRSARQTVKVDIWSAGVTLLQLVTAKLPFGSSGVDQTIKEIAKVRGIEDVSKLAEGHGHLSEELLRLDFKGISLREWAAKRRTLKDGVPSSFYDLVESCLQVDPAKRISAREAMQHEFFSPCLKARKDSAQLAG